MIAEKWDLKLDIQALREHVKQHVLDKEITWQTPAFGGWSVLSSNGDIRDGWSQGHLLYRPDLSEEAKSRIRNLFQKKMSEYICETEICTGYMKEVIDLIRHHHLSPHRARIICLTAGTGCSWHRDGPEDKYAVRLHVPIITNPGCYFETRQGRTHLDADGSAYFLYVNKEHRVVNEGKEDRFHLVMDVIDSVGVSQHHRLSDFDSSPK